MIKLDRDFKPSFPYDYKDILSTDNRRILSREANMNKANLTMYSKALFEKGAIYHSKDGGTEVNPILLFDEKDGIVEYNFKFEIEND